jgi:hypothetical protein
MKKIFAIVTVTLLLLLIPGVALAADPTDTPVTIDLTVSGGGTVNSNINLTGSTVNASVNGSTLATLPDVQNMGNSLYNNIAGTAGDLQNAKTALTALINQVKATEDASIQGQNQTINLYGDAITKLITDLSNIKNTQALDAYSTANDVQNLKDQLDAAGKDLLTLSDEVNNNQTTNLQGIQSLTKNIEQVEVSLNTLSGDTQTNYKALADALNTSNQSITDQKIKTGEANRIAIIASVIAVLSLGLAIFGLVRKPALRKAEYLQRIEETKENHAYSGK